MKCQTDNRNFDKNLWHWKIHRVVQYAHLRRFASSMNGRFWDSVRSFHSAPSRFDISELCILGFSTAILRLWPRLHTLRRIWNLYNSHMFTFFNSNLFYHKCIHRPLDMWIIHIYWCCWIWRLLWREGRHFIRFLLQDFKKFYLF